MLEGKELEGKIGDTGSYSVDVDANLKCVVEVSITKEIAGIKASTANSVELDLADLLRQATGKVQNAVFTGAVETILKVLGR
jgi:hypothetical protein